MSLRVVYIKVCVRTGTQVLHGLPFKLEELFALQVVHIKVSVRAAVQVFQVVVQLHLLHPTASNIWQFIPVPHSSDIDGVHLASTCLTRSLRKETISSSLRFC